MLRLWISATILLLGLFWLGVGGTFGNPLLNSSKQDYYTDGECLSDRSCVERLNADLARSPGGSQALSPADREAMRSAVMANDAISAMTAGLKLNEDYWMPVSGPAAPLYGETWAIAELIFRKPISFRGEVPQTSDPCEGVRGEDGDFPTPATGQAAADTECLAETKVRGSREMNVTGARYFIIEVANGNEVASVTPIELRDDTLDEMIDAVIAGQIE